MVGPRSGWAVGSHAIFTTTDGLHWIRQFTSTEEFVGLDFVDASTGWAVGVRTLLGTRDGGRTWRELGEASQPIRSVHFINALTGYGIAGGGQPSMEHGWLVPGDSATMVTTEDGGKTWVALPGPTNPQTVCFTNSTQGWVGAKEGVYLYNDSDETQSWSKVLERPAPGATGGSTLIECAGARAAWVMFVGSGAALSHRPYLAYASPDGVSWKPVLEESYTSNQNLPGVPAGPDSYPPSFSVVDPLDAVFVGDGPATGVARCLIASKGGATLQRTGQIENSWETFGAAFLSVTTGWVLTRNGGGDYVIDATTDGGYHWLQQLAVPPSSAG
jgi:photosystem II stability/assembly factor-like uncharacterized protein